MFDRFKNAWNAFRGRSPTYPMSSGGDLRQIRPYIKGGVSKSIVNTIYNKIAVDVSSINFSHVRLNEEDKYLETIDDSLNYVLRSSANIDQTGRELIKDTVITMLSEGVACIVPTKTDYDPYLTDAYKVYEARVGTIIQWYPKHVRVSVYDDDVGQRREITIEKRFCVIIVNPFYEIMNGENSTLKRLIRVLNQLDRTNEENSSNKLDLLVQLPYSVSKKIKKDQAEERRRDIERQLTGSQLGIAYIDGTERVIQLNRAVTNNLWEQSKDLLLELYNQLGISEKIFNGTANEQELLNYQNDTINPIVNAITENMTRKWLSITAQTQRQAIMAFANQFRSVPVSQLAEVSDKLTRNEILTSNEFRSIIGFKPSDDPRANQLINSNLNHPEEPPTTSSEKTNFKNTELPDEIKKLVNKT